MDYSDLLKEIIENQKTLYGLIGLIIIVYFLYSFACFVNFLISYFKKRKLAKITRKNLDKTNEIDRQNQDNVND